MDKDGNEKFEVQAFKFNDNNKISVTCTVRYCPGEFLNQCKVIIYMYLFERTIHNQWPFEGGGG